MKNKAKFVARGKILRSWKEIETDGKFCGDCLSGNENCFSVSDEVDRL